MKNVYAYVCKKCNHLSSRHGLAADGDLRAGPYVCADCGCEIAQDHDAWEYSKQQFERWESQRLAQAAFADPKIQSQFESAVRATEGSEPVPDDPGWLADEEALLVAVQNEPEEPQ